MFDSRIILDYHSLVIQDQEAKLEIMKAAPWAFPINDWRDFAGVENETNGDVYVIPLNQEVVKPTDLGKKAAQENETPIADEANSDENEKSVLHSAGLIKSLDQDTSLKTELGAAITKTVLSAISG